MKTIKDNFSAGANDYSKFRPAPPAEIFTFLCDKVAETGTAWDVGTGNGQVALVLAGKFHRVYGTDISTKQLAAAPRLDNITYLLERAEQTTLPPASVDLITVAQAIHWFDFERFYAEVKRVARPGALIAAWTYTTLEVSPGVDRIAHKLFSDITGPYWDLERRYVDNEYRTIPFPFDEIASPIFHISMGMTLQQLLGYLGTWSGVGHYKRQLGRDPLELVREELTAAWGNTITRTARWPIFMRAGYVR